MKEGKENDGNDKTRSIECQRYEKILNIKIHIIIGKFKNNKANWQKSNGKMKKGTRKESRYEILNTISKETTKETEKIRNRKKISIKKNLI